MTTPKKTTKGKAHPKQSASEQEAVIAERRVKVMNRIMAGATMREIADNLGVSVGTVAADKEAALAELREQEQMHARDYRQVEDARLNKLLRTIWPAAVQGEPWAIDRVMVIHERKARLWGYDAIPKVELMTRDALNDALTRLEEHLDPETFGKVLAILAVDADGA